MSGSRLSILLESSDIALTSGARVLAIGPRSDTDLSALSEFDLTAVQGFRPDFDALEANGINVCVSPKGRFDAVVVFLPRAKDAARAAVAQARQATDGVIIVDGQKTDGIEAIYRDTKKLTDVSPAVSKAHGKCFAITAGDFQVWQPKPRPPLPGGFVTAPGVFSADKIDPGSAALLDLLPAKLPKRIADLGAGWGYLSRAILSRDGVDILHLVEADHAALECAKLNIADPRAQFHWADALTFQADRPLDAVIMNPPFHTGRKGEPSLGRAFIAAAAAMLAPHGNLWMVANRHLPYETEIERRFQTQTEIGGDNRFKIIHAEKPRRGRR